MKTLEQLLQYKSKTFDGRDLRRLAIFIPENMLSQLGMEIADEHVGTYIPLELTRENILVQLKDDVAFGFEKALDKRGNSARSMYDVVSMWNWILEEGLEDFSEYKSYGLPLFKATAIKYGFDNPIGDDYGNESHYSQDD